MKALTNDGRNLRVPGDPDFLMLMRRTSSGNCRKEGESQPVLHDWYLSPGSLGAMCVPILREFSDGGLDESNKCFKLVY